MDNIGLEEKAEADHRAEMDPRSGGDQTGQGSDQVTFHDAPACFSEEEWKILKEWQKELYRNVMQEVHQALLSLGPLIVTTVFSLRTKEKQELRFEDSREAARIHDDAIYDPECHFNVKQEDHLPMIHPLDTEAGKGQEGCPISSEGDGISNQETLFSLNREENLYWKNPLIPEGREGNDYPSTARTMPTNNTLCIKEEAGPLSLEPREYDLGDIGNPAEREVTSLQKSPKRCTHCDQSFTEHSQLLVHMEIHTIQKVFTCSLCGEFFKNRPSLILHKSLHMGMKRYKCTECEKSFSTSSSLYRHHKSHSGERPYQCTVCGKSFTRSSYLYQHRRTHTGEKPYECKECKKGFRDSSTLRQHWMVHTGEKPYECTDCKKSFSFPSALRVHQKIHTGEKLHECTQCQKRFITSDALMRHRRAHTGETPYGCMECGKHFTQRSSLRYHQKCHAAARL
ncbi:zinc finger protein 586-like isoform X2 [Ambystoma mexicanum]|uniref:zinc finger protein 586-like isoform X2 n=1 Tax=Ambystoma mexicanum TaxID=8296 RepID=UPI0037E98F3A